MTERKRRLRPSEGLVEGVSFTEKFTFNPKEGIINPGMVITDESFDTPRPRLCVLKREENEPYGFKLWLEKQHQGHIIRHVASGGIAQRSGLQDGDRLLEVNGFYVDDVSHPDVARKMNASGNQLCLLVLDEKAYEQAASRGRDLRDVARAWGAGCTPPRLCHIRRDPASGLGITFTPMEGDVSIGERGRFSVNLVKGGAADKAGVCKGDRLVWMNGATVADLTHLALNRMMKKCADITILVIDSESEKDYMKKKMPILPAMAVPHNLPYRARKLHLVARSNSYGFLLRLEMTVSGRTYHVLRGVEEGGAAEAAGMKNGELLLEVNGEAVEALHHHDIVDRVRASPKEVSLTTISPPGLDFYTQLGLSPLLFCEDTAENDRAPAPTEKHSPQMGKDGLHNTRLCSLQKGHLGFGFDLGCALDGPEIIISKVASGGSAEKAGLAEGDVVIEVNGQNVEKRSLKDVELLTKERGEFLSLRVMNERTNRRKRSDSPSRYAPENEDEELTVL